MIECEGCGNYIDPDEIVKHNGKDYCNSCYNKVLRQEKISISSIISIKPL